MKGAESMTTTEMAQRVYELNQIQKDIDQEMVKLKERLKALGSGRYGDYGHSVSEQERESF